MSPSRPERVILGGGRQGSQTHMHCEYGKAVSASAFPHTFHLHGLQRFMLEPPFGL